MDLNDGASRGLSVAGHMNCHPRPGSRRGPAPRLHPFAFLGSASSSQTKKGRGLPTCIRIGPWRQQTFSWHRVHNIDYSGFHRPAWASWRRFLLSVEVDILVIGLRVGKRGKVFQYIGRDGGTHESQLVQPCFGSSAHNHCRPWRRRRLYDDYRRWLNLELASSDSHDTA